ncbi:MAG TPA: hypothetical protein VFT53_07135 [Candidatus Saccharimonadales bacterium]|nr:hypothetical protein [Candidatus Saccharimonadales bacterium]
MEGNIDPQNLMAPVSSIISSFKATSLRDADHRHTSMQVVKLEV